MGQGDDVQPHETESFSSFFYRSYPRLVILIMMDGACPDDAHDAVQEAMTRAYERWSILHSPHAWVYKVALRIYRRGAQRERERRAPLGNDDQASAGTEDDPQAAIVGELLVVKLMNQLPPQQRRVAALYFDGFTHEEIATTLGKTEPTVRSLLRHARDRLRDLIYAT